MRKNFIEDIKPLSREPQETKGSKIVRPVIRKEAPLLPREVPFEKGENRHTFRYALWYIAVFCVIALLFSLSFLFESATVTVSPKLLTEAFDSNDSFVASKDSTEPDTISYTVMRMKGSETIRLPSTESKILADHAVGVATLYNSYTKGNVTLAKNTALQSGDGRVYLLNKQVSIPGYVMSGDKILPGSVEVFATSVVAGEAGNLDDGDLTIQKYAKLPQGKKIYGKVSKPFTGGASGTVYTIPKGTADSAYATLNEKLKSSLISKAKVEIPDGYMFFDGATIFTPDPAVQVSYSKEPEVPLVLNGTLNAYLIKQDTLVNAIAEHSISQYNNEAIVIPKLQSLEIVPKNSAGLNPDTDNSFSFSLSGKADIIWTINKSDIQKILANRKKAEFDLVVSTIPGVEKAQVVIRPFWSRSFPEKTDKIEVIIAEPLAQ